MPARPPVFVVDTREPEHTAWDFAPDESVRRMLKFGDYTIADIEHRVCIDRKTMMDFKTTVTSGHDRFKRMLAGARSEGVRIVVIVEGNYSEIEDLHPHAPWILPQQVRGAVFSLTLDRVPVLFCGSRSRAIQCARGILTKELERFRSELRATKRF